MPARRFFRPMKGTEPKRASDGDKLLKELCNKFTKAPYQDHSTDFAFLLLARQGEFKKVIESSTDKQPLITAYVHFAQNIKDFFENPKQEVTERINQYHYSTNYYHISAKPELSYSFGDKVADYLWKTAIYMIALSLLSMSVSLSFGLIGAACFFIILIPSLCYAQIVTKKNANAVKADEVAFFHKADELRKLAEPEVQAANEEKSEVPRNAFG